MIQDEGAKRDEAQSDSSRCFTESSVLTATCVDAAVRTGMLSLFCGLHLLFSDVTLELNVTCESCSQSA